MEFLLKDIELVKYRAYYYIGLLDSNKIIMLVKINGRNDQFVSFPRSRVEKHFRRK